MEKIITTSACSDRLVIVGGGAGGLELALRLAKSGREDVLLIDRSATHVWKPRIHELAAGLRRGHVEELDYAGLGEQWGFAFEQGALCDIAPATKTITLAAIGDGRILVPERKLRFRALVLALGGVTPDMGTDGVLDHAVMLDNENDAEALARRFSAGLLAHSLARNNGPFNIVIVGSGPTGVELAAHLATDATCGALAPRSALPETRITIVEAADTFMSGMDDDVRRAISGRMDEAGVHIKTGQKVNKVSASTVKTEDGDQFPADLTIWATGRVGPLVAGDINVLSTNKKRQWRVRRSLQSIDSDAIFALGDCSYIDDDPAPPTAQAASEQAEHLARELPRYLVGEQPAKFEYEDKGTLLSLGGAGSAGAVRGYFGDDFQVRGRLARAAYRGLQRQHEFIVLGAAKGTAKLISDVFGRSGGPRLKVY